MIHIFLQLHIIGDFVIQNNKDVELRIERPLLGNIKHMFKTLVTYLVIFFGIYVFFDVLIQPYQVYLSPLLIVFLAHFIIDLGKSYITKHKDSIPFVKNSENKVFGLWSFVIDQLLHVISIILVLNVFFEFSAINIDSIILLNAVLIATFVGHEAINLLLGYLCEDYSNDSKNYVVAKYIGILERLIITPAVIFGAYELLYAIFGLKVFTGFKNKETQITDRNAFIIGNLLSLTFALSGYVYYILFV